MECDCCSGVFLGVGQSGDDPALHSRYGTKTLGIGPKDGFRSWNVTFLRPHSLDGDKSLGNSALSMSMRVFGAGKLGDGDTALHSRGGNETLELGYF